MNRKQLKSPLKITVLKGSETVFTKTFNEYPITLGRSPKTEIPLPSYDFLSRQHCCVTVEEDVICVVDLDSANGIFFHGQKTKQVQITGLAEIEIGELIVHFELQDIAYQETITEEKTNIREVLPSIEKVIPQDLKPSLPEFSEKEKHSGAKTESGAKPKLPFEAIPEAPTPTAMPFFTPASTAVDEPIVKAKPENKKTDKKQSKVERIKPPAFESELKGPQVPTSTVLQADKATATSKDKPVHVHQLASQLRPQQRVLESFVTWKDQIYNMQQYAPNSQVIMGHGELANLDVPVLKGLVSIANYDGMTTQLTIPDRFTFALERDNKTLDFEDLVKSQIIGKKNNSYNLKLGATELVTVQITDDVSVHLRYAPAPRQLSKDIGFLEDKEVRQPAMVVGFVEIFMLLVILFTETKNKETPERLMQERVARLIAQPKKVEPPPEIKKPEPPKPEKKVVEKRVPPKKVVQKKQPVPKKVVRLEKSKLLAKVNKYPVEVAKPMKVAEKPVVANVQQVGALAALNALSSSTPQSQPVAININKNAGGATALNTGGVIGTLKTSSGKLAAGGYASVKTKGLGYGTGTGYGVQGIKGTAGGRYVAGTVVGQPSLVRLSKEEGLTRAQVMDVVKRYMGQIQQCYERSLIDSPGLSGRVEYEWEIKPSGSVVWAKVKKAEMSGGDVLNSCVVGIFKGMKFPTAKNGQNTIPNIGFPFGKI